MVMPNHDGPAPFRPEHDTLQEGAPATLTIRIDYDQMTGELRLSGHLANKVTALGMMEMAKTILTAQPTAPASPVLRPTGLLVPS